MLQAFDIFSLFCCLRTLQVFLPLESGIPVDVKDLITETGIRCPTLRELQLSSGWIWQRFNQEDDWEVRELAMGNDSQNSSIFGVGL
jgi:hypothetical protein